TLALRQARAGRLGQACLTVEGVVRIYRGLATDEPARYRPELAIALSCWGLWASRRGQREQAAAMLTDAVALYRELLARCGRLRAMRRIQLSVGLAVALSNLGLARSDLGEHAEAASVAEESVLILRGLRRRNPLYRMLARNDPTAFEHCLATTVNNLGLVLAEQGRTNVACRLAEEVAAIYRRLAAMAPVVYESELARALHNLGVAAAEVGRLDTALAATQEAVYLHRCLGTTDPVGQRQYLGQALCAFAMVRVACGRDLDEALTAAEEAVGLHEELTADHPQAFSGDLHAAYRAVSQVRAALGPQPTSPPDSPDDSDQPGG
ncbi:MAG: tetratricopeptide repeat protein, partial [Pseudonocardia sp.]|nr:tetratricopeptide repeat protein [Pseudonocardia sp.]